MSADEPDGTPPTSAAALTAAADAARIRAGHGDIESARWLVRATALDELAADAQRLDAQENEIHHQLRWWRDRVRELEAAGEAAVSAELALFRGRVAGANAMLRHYALERIALGDRVMAFCDEPGALA